VIFIITGLSILGWRHWVCTNALGTSAVITSRPSFASIIAVSIILSRDAVGLAASSRDSHLLVGFAVVDHSAFNRFLFSVRNIKASTVLSLF
jgi:hypothetical protein